MREPPLGVLPCECGVSLTLATPLRTKGRPRGSKRLGNLLKTVQPGQGTGLPGPVCVVPLVCAVWADGLPDTHGSLFPSPPFLYPSHPKGFSETQLFNKCFSLSLKTISDHGVGGRIPHSERHGAVPSSGGEGWPGHFRGPF